MQKRTKIVATLGPASANPEILGAMIRAGLDVVRLNFSHSGKPEEVQERIAMIRTVAERENKPVAILGDLRGPRIRVAEVASGQIELVAGGEVVLTPESLLGTPQRITISYPELAADLHVGALILLDDGNLRLEVLELTQSMEIRCRILRGGLLSSRRGLNFPGTRLSIPSITDKDKEDIELAISERLDFLALSFVQTAADVRALNGLLAARNAAIPVIAKIETRAALQDIDAIVREAYGVMVARGDLALELSLEEVPLAQKRICQAARLAAAPVITATQMLESMITSPKPTRAEAADISNAILDGTDAIMLSGESAIGKFPVEAIATMSAIAARTEEAWLGGELPGPAPVQYPASQPEMAVGSAACQLAEHLKAAALAVFTLSASTGRRVSCHRPSAPILALCSLPETRRRLALSWGVESRDCPPIRGTAHFIHLVRDAAREFLAGPLPLGRVEEKDGDPILVLVAGVPFDVPGVTNIIKVERLNAAEEEQDG